jgi:hypothetical protein
MELENLLKEESLNPSEIVDLIEKESQFLKK